jgi:hypothetical protein
MAGIHKKSATREALRSFTTQAPRDVRKIRERKLVKGLLGLYAAAFFGALNNASSFSFC